MVTAAGSRARAGARLAAYGAWTFLLLPVQIVAVALGWRLAERLPVFYHRACFRLLGLEVQVRGRISSERPTLFVANHSSYADITILAGLTPLSFIAKREVADWPFFGLLAKLQRSVFIERHARRAAEHRDAMQRRLDAGDSLVLFPEGTSNDGNRVLEFKSALFSVAERTSGGRPLVVQPVSIAYTKLNGLPLGYALRPRFAWYGDMSLGPHLARMVGLGTVTVVVEFHRPMTIAECGSRRVLAQRCRERVAAGVEAALTGRAAVTADLDCAPLDTRFSAPEPAGLVPGNP